MTGIPWPRRARFEDGTLSFLQIPDLEFGLSWVADIGIGQIRQRVMCLTGWLIDRLVALRHSNGQPMARIYGPANTHGRGGTVAFNLLDPSGCVIDERDVAHATAAVGISIRTRSCATPLPARSPRQPGGEGRGHGPKQRSSTSTFCDCRGTGRSAPLRPWCPTSTTWSASWRSWS